MALSAHSPSLSDTSVLENLKEPRLAVVYTEWNDAIVAEQRAGVARIAAQHGARIVAEAAVPGSFELPFGVRQLLRRFKGKKQERPEAIIALGAVIRGGTPHFEYVCQAVTSGILQLNLTEKVPVIFGVLTLDTLEQAWERLGGSHGHKGEEAALTALKMIALCRG